MYERFDVFREIGRVVGESVVPPMVKLSLASVFRLLGVKKGGCIVEKESTSVSGGVGRWVARGKSKAVDLWKAPGVFMNCDITAVRVS